MSVQIIYQNKTVVSALHRPSSLLTAKCESESFEYIVDVVIVSLLAFAVHRKNVLYYEFVSRDQVINKKNILVCEMGIEKDVALR